MLRLTLAAIFFTGSHLGISGTRLRGWLMQRIGELPYLLAYSLLSLLALAWLAEAYKAAPYVETWGQVHALQPLAALLMLPACLLAVIGLTTPSPTLAGAERLLEAAEPARGILRVTRHPFLMGAALWAAIHLLVNGDLASALLFGSLLLLALAGAKSIDAKRRASAGAQWERFAAVTSILPFAAIMAGRNRLRLSEIGWWRPLLGLLAWVALLRFHAAFAGVSPLGAWLPL
ncbi:MAG: NnrU protein [Gammaproteobacteria bacterium]|nr:MAG: NnrU protein [Gammaproteobacteria bacterium]